MIASPQSRSTQRILIIGPVTPFRGGIAQHTTRLANALNEMVNVQVESFERLYPNWLYPGKFQVETTDSLHMNAPVRYCLDSINPLSWHAMAEQAISSKPDTVIIPWWTFFLAPCYRFIAHKLARAEIPIIYFCHNIVDHDSAAWKRQLSRFVLSSGTKFLTQTRTETNRLKNLLGEVPVLTHPHPVYDQFPAATQMLPRRAKLELLFFGFIRPYKGLDILIDSLSQLKDASIHTSIVGEPWGTNTEYWERRIAEAGLSERVELVARYVDEMETARYFSRADAVVLPYRSATGTGVVATAFHYVKPVIASDVGGISDVVQDGKTGFLVPPEDAEALATAIRKFVDEGITNVDANLKEASASMTWSHLAAEIVTYCNPNSETIA